MYWLFVTHIAIAPFTANGTVTQRPEAVVTAFTSQSNCEQAKALIVSHALGNYHVFADCVAQ